MEEESNSCQSQNSSLQLQLKHLKQKEQKSRDEILALRGRINHCRKAHEQLQAHCSVLEREVEARTKPVPVTRARKSGEEIWLAKECRKKVK